MDHDQANERRYVQKSFWDIDDLPDVVRGLTPAEIGQSTGLWLTAPTGLIAEMANLPQPSSGFAKVSSVKIVEQFEMTTSYNMGTPLVDDVALMVDKGIFGIPFRRLSFATDRDGYPVFRVRSKDPGESIAVSSLMRQRLVTIDFRLTRIPMPQYLATVDFSLVLHEFQIQATLSDLTQWPDSSSLHAMAMGKASQDEHDLDALYMLSSPHSLQRKPSSAPASLSSSLRGSVRALGSTVMSAPKVFFGRQSRIKDLPQAPDIDRRLAGALVPQTNTSYRTRESSMPELHGDKRS